MWERQRDIPFPILCYPALDERARLRPVALGEEAPAGSNVGHPHRVGRLRRFGEPKHLVSMGSRFGEPAQLGEASDQPALNVDRTRHVGRVMDRAGGHGCEIGGGHLHDPLVLTPIVVHLREVGLSYDAQRRIPNMLGNRQRAGAVGERFVKLAMQAIERGHQRADMSTPPLIVKRLGKNLGLAEVLQGHSRFTEHDQHGAQLEPYFKRPFQLAPAVRQRF